MMRRCYFITVLTKHCLNKNKTKSKTWINKSWVPEKLSGALIHLGLDQKRTTHGSVTARGSSSSPRLFGGGRQVFDPQLCCPPLCTKLHPSHMCASVETVKRAVQRARSLRNSGGIRETRSTFGSHRLGSDRSKNKLMLV